MQTFSFTFLYFVDHLFFNIWRWPLLLVVSTSIMTSSSVCVSIRASCNRSQSVEGLKLLDGLIVPLMFFFCLSSSRRFSFSICLSFSSSFLWIDVSAAMRRLGCPSGFFWCFGSVPLEDEGSTLLIGGLDCWGTGFAPLHFFCVDVFYQKECFLLLDCKIFINNKNKIFLIQTAP